MILRVLPVITLLAAGALGQNNSGGHIDGVVLNQLTGQPVYKVSVTIWGVSAALTDRDGKFSIGEIPPGRYRIFVEHPGFLATWYRADGLVLISIGAGQSVSNIRIAITPKGVISGRVVDADGDPVTEVSLQLHKWTKKNGARQLAPVYPAGHTDEQGNFRIANLDPGHYAVSASYTFLPRGFYPTSPDQPQNRRTFYPSTVDPEEAASITVRAGAEVRGIEIRLRKERFYNVSGTLIDSETGAPIKGLSVGLHNVEDQFSGTISTDAGKFAFTVLPGSYVLAAGNWRNPATTGRSSRSAITIKDRDVGDLVIPVQPPAMIAGTLLNEAGEAISVEVPNLSAMAGPRPGVTTHPSIGLTAVNGDAPPANSGPTKDNGSFEFKQIAKDRYRVRVEGIDPTSYVKSIRLGNTEITSGIVDLTSGSRMIRIVMSPRGAEISGAVHNAKGDPLPAAAVTILRLSSDPDAPDTWANCDLSGHFKVQGLAPGEYRIFAWEDADDPFVSSPAFPSISDPAFRALFENVATTVKVGEGARETVDVMLITHDVMMAAAAKLP